MKRLFAIILIASLWACDKAEEEPTPPPPSSATCVRTGAVCKDGTTSTATGSGACSSHGGVDHWTCK